jgi:hypothetical protein
MSQKPRTATGGYRDLDESFNRCATKAFVVAVGDLAGIADRMKNGKMKIAPASDQGLDPCPTILKRIGKPASSSGNCH